VRVSKIWRNIFYHETETKMRPCYRLEIGALSFAPGIVPEEMAFSLRDRLEFSGSK
jgi:hypothetical protein